MIGKGKGVLGTSTGVQYVRKNFLGQRSVQRVLWDAQKSDVEGNSIANSQVEKIFWITSVSELMPGGRDAQVCTNLLQQYQKLGTIQPVTTMWKLDTILQPACCCNNTWVSAIFPLIQTHIPHQHIYCAAITVCLLFSCQKHSFSETMMKSRW